MSVPQTTNCNHRSPADKPRYLTVPEAMVEIRKLNLTQIEGGGKSTGTADYGYSGNNPLSQDNA